MKTKKTTNDNIKTEVSRKINEETKTTELTFKILKRGKEISSSTVVIKEAVGIYDGTFSI